MLCGWLACGSYVSGAGKSFVAPSRLRGPRKNLAWQAIFAPLFMVVVIHGRKPARQVLGCRMRSVGSLRPAGCGGTHRAGRRQALSPAFSAASVSTADQRLGEPGGRCAAGHKRSPAPEA
jgi:hypothetical protein